MCISLLIGLHDGRDDDSIYESLAPLVVVCAVGRGRCPGSRLIGGMGLSRGEAEGVAPLFLVGSHLGRMLCAGLLLCHVGA